MPDQHETTTSHDHLSAHPFPGLLLDPQIFYQLFESAPDGIVVVDDRGLIKQINGQAEKIFGFDRQELVGEPVEKLIPERFTPRHVGHRGRYLKEPRIRPMGATMELFARRKDGSEFPVDIMLSPVETEQGKLVLSVVRDIMERKQVESQVRETREMFFRLFEFAPDAILVTDKDGLITRANAKTEELLGYSREELLGQPVGLLIPERFGARHQGHRYSYYQDPHTRPMGADLELFALRKDGSEFPVDIMLSPVEMEESTFVLAVLRDVTERKEAEAQARDALRREMLLKEEIHHRVKNNLQVISSLLYLRSLNMDGQDTLSVLRDSQSRVKSIALVHEKLYRSEDLQRLSFDEYARDLVADLLRTYEVYQHDFVIHTDIKGISLGVDTATPCGLIINELVSNALKHAFPRGEKGELWIEFRPIEGQKYELIVRDNGVGLPPDFHVQRTTSLGLKLVWDLTKQLGGQVEVESGEGSKFRITFRELQYKERW